RKNFSVWRNKKTAFEGGLFISKEALKKVPSDSQARRNQMKKRSLQDVNEHFESDFNTA
ncbi:MAG: hypothetical protein JSS06_06430, partial [Proteobacteria bacterium]|nr:hypothetical protein [Pseudomonadota bacterium]